MTHSTFGPRLREVLRSRKMRHRDLAEHLGVTREYVTMMCSGRKVPARPVELLLLHYFGEATMKYVNGKTDVMPEGKT